MIKRLLNFFSWLAAAETQGYGSRDNNRLNGEYRVRYPDGNQSEPMYLETALDYQKIFGGTVIRK